MQLFTEKTFVTGTAAVRECERNFFFSRVCTVTERLHCPEHRRELRDEEIIDSHFRDGEPPHHLCDSVASIPTTTSASQTSQWICHDEVGCIERAHPLSSLFIICTVIDQTTVLFHCINRCKISTNTYRGGVCPRQRT